MLPSNNQGSVSDLNYIHGCISMLILDTAIFAPLLPVAGSAEVSTENIQKTGRVGTGKASEVSF